MTGPRSKQEEGGDPAGRESAPGAPKVPEAPAATEQAIDESIRTLEHIRGMRDEFVDFVAGLCRIESPTDHPGAQKEVHRVLGPVLEGLGYGVRIVPGRISGDHLLAVPTRREKGRPLQLLMGHTDTVWPMDTLERMPVQIVGGQLRGPGTLDMKGGVTQMLFALRAMRELSQEPEVTPVLFLNSDEEVGSPDSKRHVRALAKRVSRAFVAEPALGLEGRIKTARKGVGRFQVRATGRAAHAGLDPRSGASAILEISNVVLKLNDMNDFPRGTTVNVGVIQGGTRPNVIAASASATVDVRVVTAAEGRRLERAIRSIEPSTPNVTLEVEGGIEVAPLERTPRNRRLWHSALGVGRQLGFDLDDALAGGGSDGNTTSLFTATLDGLGCVGDGAHADHEHILIEPSLDRCALLARLLMTPALPHHGAVVEEGDDESGP